MKKVFIGIDNGATGTVGIIDKEKVFFDFVPHFREMDYMSSSPKTISRIDTQKLEDLLSDYTDKYDSHQIIAAVERPFKNQRSITNTMNAARAFEAVLIVLEKLGIPYEVIDSKKWQKKLLPKGIKGRDKQKLASLSIGNKLFPQYRDFKHEDRDGLLIAEWLRREYKNQ